MKNSLSRKVVFTTILVLFTTIFVFGQVGEIKTSSSNNSGSSSGGYSGNGGEPCMDAFFATCASGCFQFCINEGFSLMWDLHKGILEKKDEVPSVTSLEVMPMFGTDLGGMFMIMPRIRGNWGLFSTDYRYFSLIEEGTQGGYEYYNTHDWEVLVFNPVVTQPFTLRIGFGFMYEQYSTNFYSDYFLGLDFRSVSERVEFNLEGRVATDYQNPSPRYEGGLRCNIELMQVRNFHNYISFGVLYQNYYEKVDLIALQLGLNMMFK